MFRMKVLLATMCALLLVHCATQKAPLNQESVTALAPADVQYHVNHLASDSLQGRLSGTPGGDAAAEYITAEFKRLGLQPLGENQTYLQKFEFVGGVELGNKNFLRTSRAGKDTTWALKTDFVPLSSSASSLLEKTEGLAFVGYGIAAEKSNYNDYAGLDVKGKVVVALRYSPAGDDPHSPLREFESARYKALHAREHGAAALLLVIGKNDSSLPALKFDRAGGDAGLPVVYVTRRVASWLLQNSGHALDALQDSIDAAKTPRSFLIAESNAQLETEVLKQKRVAANVIGMLPGTDTQWQKQAVIIGAHYDHLGRSSEGALDPDRVNEIHNGADDNASGTSGILELAQYFAAAEHRPKRSLIFMGFAGEELGLLGSAHYTGQPTFPLEQTVTMINLDMIGRVKDSALVVQGVGTAPNFTELVQRNNTELKLSLKKDGLGPSDHSSFYQKNVPVLFFFTGLHDDYHRVSDDAEKINAPGTVQVLNLVVKIATEIANSDSLPVFTKVESGERQMASSFRVYVGTVPDYASDVEGMKLSGVRAGGPAERAGLQAGDIIIRFDKLDIKNIYDYTYALAEFSPGDEVEVIVLRGTEKKTMKLKLEAGRR